MIAIVLILLATAAMAAVPVVSARFLLTGLSVPRAIRASGHVAPLVATRSGEIGGRIGVLTLDVVGPLPDIAQALGPEDIAETVNRLFERERVALLDRVAQKQLGVLWRGLPGAAKVQFEDYLARSVPKAVDRAVVEIIDAIGDLLDVPAMQTRYFGARPTDLARMIGTVTVPAFRSLRILMPVLALPAVLVVVCAPGIGGLVAGAVLAFAASAAALRWLFLAPPPSLARLPERCVTPLLFERRQITDFYADTVADEAFRLDVVIDELIHGRPGIAVRAIIERRVGAIFSRLPGRPLLDLVIPQRAMRGMVEAATDELVALLSEASRDPELSVRCAGRLRTWVTDRFEALEPGAFLEVQRRVLRRELPLMHSLVIGLVLAVGLVAAAV
ncbi:hypothetical protein L2U69_05545 [Zavarzinia compransoris]|uniref:hypothetical protein n=1 Tax=Zavarzinia marina TaxID=2911065 RepID=UPI001F3E43EE|nr:hypothetical protein [Zavarzinia marina]MCF4165098.1 hypothetical protein [Zavarzinia marina]